MTTATASNRTGSRSQNGEPSENRIVGAPSTILAILPYRRAPELRIRALSV